jgi:hypothetical protein
LLVWINRWLHNAAASTCSRRDCRLAKLERMRSGSAPASVGLDCAAMAALAATRESIEAGSSSGGLDTTGSSSCSAAGVKVATSTKTDKT